MIIKAPFATPTPLRQAINDAYHMDETQCVEHLLSHTQFSPETKDRIFKRAYEMVERVRQKHQESGGLDALLEEYDLSSQEGVALMCLAEALLRIPDEETTDRLIKDLLGEAHWEKHLGESTSPFVNASTWALMLTGRLITAKDKTKEPDWRRNLLSYTARVGEPIIRQAIRQAVKIMGRQFVMGRNLKEALTRSRSQEEKGYIYSYDMLGEGARTMADADHYFQAYAESIDQLAPQANGKKIADAPSISVKLSALHPRYEFAQKERVTTELLPRLIRLCRLAMGAGIGLTIDAEEADRLDISLDLIEALSRDPSLKDWPGLGLAVQAYQKRSLPTIGWLADLAKSCERRFMVRLVKGAYWDTEIKRAQVNGLEGYPVFTRKASTDVSYIACAKKMLENRDQFYCAFATHNAHTLATVLELVGPDDKDFEVQRLHGMGESLFAPLLGDTRCRVYAPVGNHEDLLAYLVRRLLENGANSSFVNRVTDKDHPIEEIIADPVKTVSQFSTIPHPHLPMPEDLLGEERKNSQGFELSDPQELNTLIQELETCSTQDYSKPTAEQPITNPANRDEIIGRYQPATPETSLAAFEAAVSEQDQWEKVPAQERAALLTKAADLFEVNRSPLIYLLIKEAGKTLADAQNELREAVDFLRYYAFRAKEEFSSPQNMPGPTGEENKLSLHGRGVFVCISPWNFPLAIFTGQISAALAAGNTVLAKPAEQTTLVAEFATDLLHKAGIPKLALQLIPGSGSDLISPLLPLDQLAGVAFTGSTATAQIINKQLAARSGPIIPFIAETGGQNAMIVDSSALPEQVTDDVLASAFQSAGQRCSALRVLFVQEELAGKLLPMIAGAMAELDVGDPAYLSTDLGPVIDEAAVKTLTAHAKRMSEEGKLLYKSSLEEHTKSGSFFAPHAFEIDSLDRLEGEVFGPILHIIRYQSKNLEGVIKAINNTGFGLTLGVHSRISDTIEFIQERAKVGNLYINRNQIGAIVGMQPFGGEGLSGTGPKAGGPRYLHRFATERTVSVDTTAAGGNTSLMTMGENR